jgi:hypothetical protein
MAAISQTASEPMPRWRLVSVLVIVLLSLLPSLMEAYALLWGARKGYTGMALRDGLDLWTGGHLVWSGHVGTVFDPVAYRAFIASRFGPGLPMHLPTHMWSYPPTFLLIAAGFAWLPPWPAVLAFDLMSLALLIIVLRLGGQRWALVLAVAASPVALENLLEGQNAALMTALIGGGLLLLERRPRLGGILIGLASIKPQLGLPLPVFLLRWPAAFAGAALAALGLALVALVCLGPAAFNAFWHVTRPAMDDVLLLGRPKEFAGGLISVFASFRALGVPSAFALQAACTLAAVALAARTRNLPAILILCALASPYLHVYDLLGVTLATALLVQRRLAQGFAPGEALLFFLAWVAPGALPWLPHLAHAVPLLLALLLASALRRDRVPPCDSPIAPALSPASSAGR